MIGVILMVSLYDTLDIFTYELKNNLKKSDLKL